MIVQLPVNGFNLLKLKELHHLFIVEGDAEERILKFVLRELMPETAEKVAIGVSNCKGIKNVLFLSNVITTLTRILRRMRSIGIIIDAERLTPKQRLQSLVNSLKSHQKLDVKILKEENPFIITVGESKLKISILVSYLPLPFEIHAVEDFEVCVLVERGKIKMSQLAGVRSGKEMIERIGINQEEILARDEALEKCFKLIADFVRQTVEV